MLKTLCVEKNGQVTGGALENKYVEIIKEKTEIHFHGQEDAGRSVTSSLSPDSSFSLSCYLSSSQPCWNRTRMLKKKKNQLIKFESEKGLRV